SPQARAALGYLAELFRFPGWHSADEVLELHQRLAGSTGGASERTRLLELVALVEARNRRVEAMSKGMQQRLGGAAAPVGRPRPPPATTRRASSPSSSPPAGRSTASESSPRRSRRSTSTRWAARPRDRRLDDRPLRPRGGPAAEGLRRRLGADRGLPGPLRARQPLRLPRPLGRATAGGDRRALLRRGLHLRAGHVRDALPRSRARGLPHPRRRPRRRGTG